MKINQIYLENYRNIKNLDLKFDNVNIIWGENAQGKTNLLESIYLFTGQGTFRGGFDKQIINFDSDSACAEIDFFAKNREQDAKIVLNRFEKNEAYLNGIKQNSFSNFGDTIKTVVFSPVHLSIVKGSPQERRKFVDNALGQIKSGYNNLLKSYQRTLYQRNNTLKKATKDSSQYEMIPVWDSYLAKYGSKIIYQRMKYLQSIQPYIDETFEGLTEGKEKVNLEYETELFQDDISYIEEIEVAYEFALEENRDMDIQFCTTSVGPHRDDFSISINNCDARTYASQGQQRSCVLGLKLAETALLNEMTDERPVALLDDVMSELDEKRQDYILNQIKDWQVFVTCCDKNTILRLKEGKTFQLSNGQLKEE